MRFPSKTADTVSSNLRPVAEGWGDEFFFFKRSFNGSALHADE